jgi:hypothetical protein
VAYIHATSLDKNHDIHNTNKNNIIFYLVHDNASVSPSPEEQHLEKNNIIIKYEWSIRDQTSTCANPH